MKTSTVETLVWVLIYGGLVVLCLSLFVPQNQGALGTTLTVAGTLATALGAVLIVVRSRMKDNNR